MASPKKEYSARYYQKEKDQRITCALCPRQCILQEGKRGFCFVRQNIGGEMALTTYGRSSGFCIDPIEKKPLNHFYPGSAILSFGTAGCNLGCKFCQNWDISKSRESDRLCEEAAPERIAEAAVQYQCKSVAFTYNDPVIFAEYAIDVAKACHQQKIKTVAVTAGYINPEARKDFFEPMDAANVDLKSFSDDFYKRLTLGKLQPVLDTLIYLKKKTDVWLEITTLIIPGENDSDDEMSRMCEWISQELGPDVPLHLSAFHPDFQLTDHPATSAKTLSRLRSLAISKGIRYVYAGNVHGKEEASTYCHHCKKLLIERDWYALGEYHIKDGKCAYCSTTISGHFENQPGQWQARRQPLHMGGE
ncbi:MAG: AmmeMemoRadiSam system radical SAM enzyme [Candidatus Omnitrophota bacterium]